MQRGLSVPFPLPAQRARGCKAGSTPSTLTAGRTLRAQPEGSQPTPPSSRHGDHPAGFRFASATNRAEVFERRASEVNEAAALATA